MADQAGSTSALSSEWRILVIDDDEEDYLITRNLLREARGQKFAVRWANTFAAGREELRANHYDAVLVDYDLGIHTGIELIRFASERGYPAPLILFTGRGNYEVDVEAMEAGATLYLTKNEANPLLLERAVRYAIDMKQKEQSLRASEARERAKAAELNAVLDAVPAIVWITRDPLAREITGNQAAEEFLRIPDGKNLSLSAPDDAPRHFKVFQEGRELAPEELPIQITARTGQPIRNFEEEVVFEDGERAHLLGNVTPLLDEDGKPGGAVGAFLNITERKRSEQARNRAEEKFAKAFHSSPVGLVITRSADGRYLEVNNCFCQMTGYERDEVIGHTALELGIYAVPEQRAEIISLLTEHGFLPNYEFTIRTKSGAIRTILASFDLAEIDFEACLLATLIDITERKQAEESLAQAREQEKWMARFPEENPNPVVRIAADGRVLYCNPTSEKLPGWECAVGQPLPEPLRSLGEKALPQGQEVHEDVFVGRRYYAISVLPIDGTNYANLYGIDITERKNVEATLAEGEERLREFLATTHASFFTLDRDWRIRYANRRFAEMTQKSAEETIGKVIWEIFPRHVGTPFDQACREAMAKRAPIHLETGGILSPAWYQVSIYPTRDGISVFSVDWTEEHAAVLALRESEERYRTFFDQLYETVTIFEAVRDERGEISDFLYQDVNQTALKMLGVPAGEIIGKTVSQVLGAEILNQYIAEYGEVLKTGTPSFHETSFQDRCFLVSVSRITENRLASIGLDITERERADAQRRNTEERYQRLFNTIDQGFCVIEMLFDENQKPVDYSFLEINPAFERQTGMRDVIGRRIREIAPNHEEYWFEIYGEIARTGVPKRFEGRASQMERYFDLYAYRVGSPEERKVAVLFTDITERKQAEEALIETTRKLARSNRELEQFAFVASHDLQEPLRKIVSFGDLLLHEYGEESPEQAKDYVQRMRQAAGRMQRMIRGLLDLSRVNTHGAQFAPVALRRAAQEALLDLEDRLQAAGGQVIIEDLPTIEADEMQMRQLFLNLIGNAVKFHKPGVPPLVRISSTAAASQNSPVCEIRVADNGIGFEQKYAEQITQPFQRLHDRSQYEGTGLGLAICHKIVERHQGSIEIQSTPGEGTIVTVRLPLGPL